MDKNCVKRRGVMGKPATDSEARKGSKQLRVNVARLEGKLSFLSGEVSTVGYDRVRRLAETIVVGEGKKRTKGRTDKELGRKSRQRRG
jgi:hypothetical protein